MQLAKLISAALGSVVLITGSLCAQYAGGAGDGHDIRAASAQLASFPLAGIYSGGAGDGHDLRGVTVQLATFDLAGIYSGGAGDGHDLEAATVQLATFDLAGIYSGGAGDGHDLEAAIAQLATFPLAGIYSGGAGGGYDFASGSTSAPVPLTLIALAAAAEGGAVVVTWTTAEERGTDFFVVERGGARDAAASFTELGEVTATGNGRAAGLSHDYRFLDESPLAGTAYYRLRIHDLDGAVETSDLVAVTRALLEGPRPDWDFALAPNPNPGGALSVLPKGLPADDDLRITVTDASGRVVTEGRYDYRGGDRRIGLALDGTLAAGVYLVRVTSGAEVYAKALVVARAGS